MNVNTKPFFSVLLSVFNTGKYLQECLASIQGKTCSFEIIAVDDGSTDNSADLLKQFQTGFTGTMRCISHQKNAGLYEARRSGVKNANGEYLLFLDSDDALMPGALDRLYQVLKENPVDILGYGLKTFPLDETWIPDNESVNPDEMVKALLRTEKPAKTLLVHTVYRAEFAKKIYEQMPAFYANQGEDIYQSILMAANASSIHFLPEVLYRYRYGSGCSTRSDLSYERFEAARQSLLNVYQATEDYLNKPPFQGKYDVSGLKKRILHDLICEYILIMMAEKDKDRALISLTRYFEADLLIPYLYEARTRHNRLIHEDDCFAAAAKLRNILDALFPPETRRRRAGKIVYTILIAPFRGLWRILHKIIRTLHPHKDDVRKAKLAAADK